MDSYSNFMRSQGERARQEQSAKEAEAAAERGRRLRVAGSPETAPPAADQLVVRGRITKEGMQAALAQDLQEQRVRIKFELLHAELAFLFKAEKHPKMLIDLATEAMTPDELSELLSMRTPAIVALAPKLALRARAAAYEKGRKLETAVEHAFDRVDDDASAQLGAK